MKKYNKISLVMLMTILSVALFAGPGSIKNIESAVATSSNISSTVDFEKIGEPCLDAVIAVYGAEYLQGEEYQLTIANRHKIQKMLANMGKLNIAKLNEAVYSGDSDKAVEGIRQFVETNFGWEEHEVMKKYILN